MAVERGKEKSKPRSVGKNEWVNLPHVASANAPQKSILRRPIVSRAQRAGIVAARETDGNQGKKADEGRLSVRAVRDK